MSLIRGALQPGLSVVKKTAPFYSAVDEALAAIKRPKGTGAEFYTELTKQAGVKKAELADRKLEQAFKAKGKMTKEEAQQVLKDNPPPKVEERQLTEIDDSTRERMLDEKLETSGYDSLREVPYRKIAAWNKEIDADMEKYGDYKTAGGQNYREILLKLPESFPKRDFDRLLTLEAEQRRGELTTAQIKELVDLQAKKQTGPSNYVSGHWQEDPNVLAHMRVQDRKGPNGEKILHVEELQSDWHQEGRKKGYASEDKPMKMAGEAISLGDNTYGVKWQDGSVDTLGYGKKHAEIIAQEGKLTGVVPDAPFKKNWHELAMKRLLNYAADNGYDSIAITPGAEQANRFGLEKHIQKLHYNADIKRLRAFNHSGREILSKDMTPEELSKNIGAELAGKLLQQPSEFGVHTLADQDIKIGGEGMKGFYDKMLPDYLNTFGKPYGAQVGQIDAIMSNPTPEQVRQYHGLGILRFDIKTPEEKELLKQQMLQAQVPLHNFPITPEMRESIKQKGLPLYQQVGIPTAGAGAASQMPEQEEPQYGTGGAIAKMALKAAPQVVKPSTLTELKKVVQQEKGGYGARRVERAADEVPNLEKLYKEQALKEAFLGDNAKALMTMNPADFEKYAAKLLPRNVSVPGVMGDKMRQSTEDYVKYLRELPEGFNEAPYLLINKEEFGLPLIPYVTGHEGRHRNRALTTQGEKSNLVRFVPSFELREPLPRRSQEEYIEGLKQELQMTGNQVMPEKYWDDSLPKNLLIQRPPIQLPDIYAKGGAVKPKVKDSKSGKVRMTENRDTMFMELSNKKLKRK
jgi:hypothetical protein